ncbi:helix-turn-helix domain-containing protein [Actinomadura sp. 21ATH]|uniref:helix-turn-helix domain-containing protein n=1 Tax=Actinomadura sp. 21ATH TaxID=1735444 RepID=UPI0035C1BEC8
MPGPGNVGERVRNLRLTRRLSQAQLAGHDLSDSYISLIESGKRTPTPTVLRMLAERLGCTPEYLAEGVEPEQRAHLEVRERHAHLALLAGDAATAESGFDDVLARSDDPDLTSRARWGRARALEELGRTAEAIALFEELREQAERDPGRASWLPPVIALARCYHAVGDLGQAIALAERALARLGQLRLRTGHEYTEVGRILLLAYVDRSDPVRAHALGRRVLGAPPGGGDEGEETEPTRAYQRASSRALEEGSVGDALYFADQALTAHGGVTPTLARARLNLAGAKALLRGVAPFSAEENGTEASSALRRNESARTAAAEEAIELLRGTAALEGAEGIESTIERARALVLVGRPEKAIALLEKFLDTGRALAAPPSADLDHLNSVPAGDVAAHVRKTTQARAVLARARLAQQDPTAALVVLRTAVGELDRLPAGRPAAQLFRELGELFEAAGDGKGATGAYRQALEAAGLRPARSHNATQAVS